MSPLNIIFSQNWHFNIFYTLMLILVASLPFTHLLVIPIAILMFLNWIWEWNWKEKWMNVKDHKATLVFILSAALFLIPLYGILISTNKMHALLTVETYLWFLLAPLFLLTYASTLLTHERIRILLVLFSISTIFLSLFVFGDALVAKLQNGGNDFSFYLHISEHYHPSYLSLYMSLTIFLMLFDWKKRRRQLHIVVKIIYGAIILFLYAAIICASSKAGIIIILALCLYWIFFLFKKWKYRILGLLLFIAMNTAFGAALYHFKATPFIRVNNALTVIKNFEINNTYSYTSSGIRLTVWRSAWEVAKDNHFLGTGTGDLDKDLVMNAELKGYKNLIGHHYNAHNQWLQALTTSGIIGFLIVLAYTLFPLIYGIRKRDVLYITFSLLTIGNLLVESMFERKMGAVFIALFFVLLYVRIPKQELIFNLGTDEETADTTPAPQSPSPEE
ncbi:MAG: O-antigen ligase family protein [Bacteroidales bacterium]|nr:O-antigen ligase family protein [Bacteroidales bacterium]